MGDPDQAEERGQATPIVVVDPDPTSRNLAEDLEDELDRQVIAIDSEDFDSEANDEIAAAGLVIVAWDLAVRSGSDLIEEIRGNPRLAEKTVLVALDRPTRASLRQALVLGADSVCCKPYDAEEIRARLAALEARRGARAA